MNQAALKRIFSEAFRLSAEGRTSRKMFWLANLATFDNILEICLRHPGLLVAADDPPPA